MDEIRSSWEIAREKAEKLGRLSPAEQKKQNEERCLPIAKSIFEKYIRNDDIKLLEYELSKYSKEDGELIRYIFRNQLIESIGLNNSSELEKLCAGITSLIRNQNMAEIMVKVKGIIYAYDKAVDSEKQNIERYGMKILLQYKIAGTAIAKINIEAREEWLQKMNKLTLSSEQSLNNLKEELLLTV